MARLSARLTASSAVLLSLCLSLLDSPAVAEVRGSKQVVDFVDPLIGTINGGWFAFFLLSSPAGKYSHT